MSIDTESRLEYLTSKVAEATFDLRKVENLGQLALEALIEHERLEEILKSDASKEEKRQAREDLEKVRELEKSIVKLYIFSRYSGRDDKSLFMKYIMSRYTRLGGIP